jgi:hypothetical protein
MTTICVCIYQHFFGFVQVWEEVSDDGEDVEEVQNDAGTAEKPSGDPVRGLHVLQRPSKMAYFDFFFM